MIRKWFEMIFDHKISLRERMFRMATWSCMVAAAIVLPMGKSVVNWVILAAGLIFMAAVMRVSIRKDCINIGATAIAGMACHLFHLY